MRRRLSAVLCLFVLSPLIAEYLLGSLPLAMLGILPVMALLYGSGAVLIRELVRGSGRGWPSLILLACAYGVFEEGLVTQSLFNPNYLNLRLLDYGFIPALGTSAPWLVYVIGLHVFWSISTPIALTEALFLRQRATPWLGKGGLVLFSLLFAIGAALIAFFTYKQSPFLAAPAQLAGSAAVIIGLCAAAFLIPKPRAARAGTAPHAAIVFALMLACGSGFVGAELWSRASHLPWAAATAAMLGCALIALVFVLAYGRGRAWSDMQRFALMAGGLGVYIWLGFILDRQLHADDPLIGHAGLAAVLLILCCVAGARAAGRLAITETASGISP
jgi:hypothetical protein